MPVTPTKACGGECGLSSVGATPSPDNRHIHAFGGTTPVSQTMVTKNSRGRAWRCTATSGSSYLQFNVTGAIHVLRFDLSLQTLPTMDFPIMRVVIAPGSYAILRYRAATQDIVTRLEGAASTTSTAVPVVAGAFYSISIRVDASTATRAVALTVDGVSKGSGTLANDVGAASAIRLGICATATADLVIDNIVMGVISAEYPYPAMEVVWHQITGDGTHSYSAAGDFKYNNSTNVAPAATDTWTYLTGLLDSAASFLAAAGVAVGEYLEWLFTGFPATSAIHGVEVVSAHLGSDANAHKQTLRIVDGASVSDVMTDADHSQSTLSYNSKMYALAPSGVAWTTALLNGIKFRWGSSWTAVDIVGVPEIAALGCEVACVLSAAPTQSGTSTLQHPEHTYQVAGTYLVTLEVEDDDGHIDTVQHPVTVL